MLPAFRCARAAPGPVLKGVRTTTSSPSFTRLRNLLIVGEVALSVVLMVGATLLVRSSRNIESELGYDRAGILSLSVPLPSDRYNGRQRVALYRELHEKIAALPGVRRVSAKSGPIPLELSAGSTMWPFRFIGMPVPQPPTAQTATVHEIVPGYLPTIGVNIVRGRDIIETDAQGSASAALVNEALVQRYLRGVDPIGRELTEGPEGFYEDRKYRVVGVVANHRIDRPPAEIAPAIYIYQPLVMGAQTLIIRTELSNPMTLLPSIRGIIRDLDPELYAYREMTFEQSVARSLWRERLQSKVIGIFAVLAVLLAVCGIYGVLSYATARRTSEFGIRIAVGASGTQLGKLVIGDGARLTLIGAAIGTVVALAATQLLESLLYGVRPTDALTYVGVVGGLVLVGLLAAWIPARRAARLDPLTAIRAE
jgi:predicted permease